MDVFTPLSKNLGFTNARKKFYPLPDGSRRLVETCVFSEPVYNSNHLESDFKPFRKKSFDPDQDPDREAEASSGAGSDFSVRRARRRLFDLVSCNPDCNMMATLTLNGQDFPRDNWAVVVPRLSTWLDNMQRRHGLKYILVPEYHKDGKSIHFHGFVNEDSLKLSRAFNPKTAKPLFQNGRAVYNIDNWKYGFTTAVRVGKSELDQSSSAKYVLKYVTKNSEKIGGRYYLHGGSLAEPTFEYFNTDFNEIGGEEWQQFSITNNLSCKICRA